MTGLINANPTVYEKKERRIRPEAREVEDEYSVEAIDQLEVFDHIRDIKDPEHPYSLEELKVITEDSVEIDDKRNHIRVTFTPTVEHCSMATVIGLCLRVKLLRSLPSRFKAVTMCRGISDGIMKPIMVVKLHPAVKLADLVDIRVAPGTHATEAAVNKQLNDKERVTAALENPNLVDMVNECLAPSYE